MKPHPGAMALAEKLGAAAATPLPLPATRAHGETALVAERQTVARLPRSQERQIRPKEKAATQAITIRPSAGLLNKYVLAAAERTRASGRVVSAQEMMLEVLESGL